MCALNLSLTTKISYENIYVKISRLLLQCFQNQSLNFKYGLPLTDELTSAFILRMGVKLEHVLIPESLNGKTDVHFISIPKLFWEVLYLPKPRTFDFDDWLDWMAEIHQTNIIINFAIFGSKSRLNEIFVKFCFFSESFYVKIVLYERSFHESCLFRYLPNMEGT